MQRTQRLDALVAPLREDVLSGASELARKAAHVLAQAIETEPAGTDVRALVADVGRRILDSQPTMAPLVGLVAEAMRAAAGAPSPDEARRAVRRSADAFAGGVEARAPALAARAARLLPREGDVLTLSSSSAVLATLLRARESRRGRVVVLESRPAGEGRDAARALAAAGVPVLFAVDAAAASLVPSCAAVLLGADSIGDRGVVNKVGSLAVALSAERAGVPVLVVGDPTKILPPGFPQHLADDRPAEQVWAAPAGVTVWNRYFEAVPLHVVTRVITDRAAMRPDELERHRRGLVVPEELRAWAIARTGQTP
jgi:translation initiation factor 2B subunit (eIF-2B alpha/beta/delta family)